TILMAKEELEALRTAFESGDIPQAASRLRELLASSESTRLEVGVTGESGAGKSSLINALRGLGAEDPGAALTGVVETTMQPSSYPHPQFPDVTLWDLPGAGCPGCPADKYLKQVDFGRYDFFLLVSPRRCGAVEARLASEILRQGKKFYFVRTKVDEDLAATRSQRPSGFSESMVLQEIRDHCTERLRAAGVTDPRIFLVSNLWPVRYDFPLLLSTWEHDLPAHRRHAGLLSLPDISLEALQRKKDMLQEQVLKTALVSGVIQALPVPGLAAAYDDALLIRSLRGYHRSFGLDEDSLAKLAEQVGKQAGDLRSVIRSPLANEVSPETVLRLYSQSSDGAMRVARAFERGIPVFGGAANVLGLLRAGEKRGQLRVNTLPYLSCQRSSSPKDVELGVRQPMANQIFQFNISELSKDTGALKETFEAGNLPAVAAKLQATLHSLEDVRLDIGVTGAIGSGKSTFVNAIRGLGDEDPKSAGTGVVEMTVEPTPYPHPKYFNIIIWDLPGIDAPTFQADEYLQRVLVDRYDFFIIITPDSFTARHAQLARGLRQQGKAFYFVRSKVDVDLAASSSRRPSTFSEQRVLRQIREDCWQRLEATSQSQDSKVFLLSMFELGRYDFGLLEESMVTGVQSHKQHALLVALPNLSEAILEKKASSLRQHIWLVATVACGINSSPVPGVQDVACDLYRLIHALEGYYHSFGLDEDSLVKLA
uniref:Immunity related GTPase cinema n=1 Tax=Myotis lucifugus TaxID=59463 RepID=G1PEC8_MYOLU